MPSTAAQRQWITAWRSAGVELARIRSEELSEIDDQTATLQATWLGVVEQIPPKPESGLLQFQEWMLKWRRGAL